MKSEAKIKAQNTKERQMSEYSSQKQALTSLKSTPLDPDGVTCLHCGGNILDSETPKTCVASQLPHRTPEQEKEDEEEEEKQQKKAEEEQKKKKKREKEEEQESTSEKEYVFSDPLRKDPLYLSYVDYVLGKKAELSHEDRMKCARVRKLPGHFLDCGDYMGLTQLKEVKKKIDLSPFRFATSIENDFLAYMSQFQGTVDCSQLPNIKEINSNSFLFSARHVPLLHAEVWIEAKVTDEGSGGWDYLQGTFDEAYKNVLLKKKQEAIHNMCLLSYKSNSKLGKLLNSEWVSRQVVSKFLIPKFSKRVRKEEKKEAAMIPSDDSDLEFD